jgi:IS5 family transposase
MGHGNVNPFAPAREQIGTPWKQTVETINHLHEVPMRKMIATQMPLVHQPIDHPHAREYAAISDLLDEHPEALQLVYQDLIGSGARPDRGREALTAEQVLRIVVVKQLEQLSYVDLAFALQDSATFGAFCRLGVGGRRPDTTVLNRNIKSLSAECLEAVNIIIIRAAQHEGIESGRKVRFDCTVTETNIHEPSDSSLLWDCFRVLTRLAHRGRELSENLKIAFVDHTRRAKRRFLGILNAKNKTDRRSLYVDLLKVTRKAMSDARRVAAPLLEFPPLDIMDGLRADAVVQEIEHYRELAEHVMEQTRRRVLCEERVAASDKLFSIFEPHTDIIIKDRRDVHYGHKLCLATGASGLVFDVMVLEGNPADSTLSVDVVRRTAEVLDSMPNSVAFDGGFASRQNLQDIKDMGVKQVAFAKGRGLQAEEMAGSKRSFRRLRNFRAGIEAGISLLKRCFGMRRCTWRSLQSYQAYVWASVLSANLLTVVRRRALAAEKRPAKAA